MSDRLGDYYHGTLLASNKPLCGEILDFPKDHHTCDEELGHYPSKPHVSRGESLGIPFELSWGKGIGRRNNAKISERQADS